MALGIPVVTTSVGCEGLGLTDGVEALISDDPSTFADLVCKLLDDPELWSRVSANARRCAEEHFSWDSIAPKLLQVYSSLVANTRPVQLS
jgi:glycosyltransferase involved in cell wall biosynthesis